MTDKLSLLLQNPEMLNLAGQLNPRYDDGKKLGSEGREPPMTLNQVTRIKPPKREDSFGLIKGGKDKDHFYKIDYKLEDIFGQKDRKPRVETELDPNAFSFRQGYMDGLQQFATAQGIDFLTTGLFQGLDVIASDDGLTGFVRGARVESPNIPRNYSPASKRGKFEYILNEPESEWVQEMRFKTLTTQAGYRLGFTVGIAREHGVVLKAEQVPMDNALYQAFTQGLNGEARPLPPEALKSHSKDLYLIKEESPLVAEMKAFDWVDNEAYHTGLQIWLKSQRITGVDTWQIRHPEAMRAFKAALNGETIREYEPQKQDDPFDLDKQRKQDGIYSILEKHYLKPNEDMFADKFRTEPTPMDIARQQGQAAYNLGKQVRFLKK